MLDLGNFLNKDNFAPLVTVTGTVFAYFSLVILSFGDFSRYVKNERELNKGNLSLILNLVIFSIFALFIVTGVDAFLNQKMHLFLHSKQRHQYAILLHNSKHAMIEVYFELQLLWIAFVQFLAL